MGCSAAVLPGQVTSGGRRAGAGRPRLPHKAKLVATVQQEHLDYLTERAYKSGVTVSELLRDIIESVSQCYVCDPHLEETVTAAHLRGWMRILKCARRAT
jgi:NifB/MoaA-like Fe-S oxidoreductase